MKELIKALLSERAAQENNITAVEVTESGIMVSLSPRIELKYERPDCQEAVEAYPYDSETVTIQGLGMPGKALRYQVTKVRLGYLDDAGEFKTFTAPVPGVRSDLLVTDEVIDQFLFFNVECNLSLADSVQLLQAVYGVQTSVSAVERWKTREAEALPAVGQLITMLNEKKTITTLHLDEYKASGTQSWELAIRNEHDRLLFSIRLKKRDAWHIEAILRWFRMLGLDIKLFYVDFWLAYPPAIKAIYPDADIQYDFFHVIQNIHRHLYKALTAYRKAFPELQGTAKGLWIEPGMLVNLINGWQLANLAIELSYRLRPRLKPTTGPGRKQTYSDATVLLTVIVMRVWRKGYESFTGWLGRNRALAESLGYDKYDAHGQLKTISSSQLSRRTRQLGCWPFLFFFIGLVWQLICLGAITGRDLIIDASLLKSWYRYDREAGWSYPTRWRGSIFGYKIHTVVCRQQVLPVFFWVTPANAADCVWAVPLLAVVVVLYGFEIAIVRADAAYFTKKIVRFIYHNLQADPFVDYNVRRKNKQLVTLQFIWEWEGLMGSRSDIERHFAWAKRYFGLKYFQVEGWLKVMTYACCTYIAILAVAVVAYRCQRPELARSRTNVLAWA